MKKEKILLIALALTMLTGCGSSDGKKEGSSSSGSTGSTGSSGSSETPGGSTESGESSGKYAGMSAEEITARLTLEQKASQMVLPAIQFTSTSGMEDNCYGGVLSKVQTLNAEDWRETVDEYQEAALGSEAGIPIIYGQDDVHGVNYCLDTVIFPHNIGLGAANDPELTYQAGLITADEAKLCHMLWNYAPCVAQSVDPRWGRTYESYGSDLGIITELSSKYTQGLLDGGIIACAKHFFADGNVLYGTGEVSDVARIIDRGDAQLSDSEIADLLAVYQKLVDTGVQTIMISHSSLNGVKMHENAEYIQKLKNEMHFDGFIVSDWNSVQNTTPNTYYDQVVTSVNAGIDMFMEVQDFETTRDNIVKAVNNGDVTEERVNDAVTRILRVKINAGVMEDPFGKKMTTVRQTTGSAEYRSVAEKLVEESLVLLKNEGQVLPLKSGSKVYITGPAADNPQAQCGGWTIDWNQSPSYDISGVTTIQAGFQQLAGQYGIEVITDRSRAEEADVVLLVVGEESYAEWNGDTQDLQLCGDHGLSGNSAAIDEAKALGKPTVACIVAGRNVIISDYVNDWDAVVMCYLPGSEGQGVADVLCGGAAFHGKLPSPWYSSIDQIPSGTPWLEQGYGLTGSE